jgi:hypothetical protein
MIRFGIIMTGAFVALSYEVFLVRCFEEPKMQIMDIETTNS